MTAEEERSWYVVHTYSGYEHKVKAALEERIRGLGKPDLFGEILVPSEKVVELVKGKKKTSSRKFFPGYILVNMKLNNETWHIVKSTPKVLFEQGEQVKVVDGPFQDFNGVVEEVKPDKGKLRVLISIFGRATPVELDFVQVEKA